jgi:hypothetical protein
LLVVVVGEQGVTVVLLAAAVQAVLELILGFH